MIGLDFSSLWPEVKPRPPVLPVNGRTIPKIKDAQKKHIDAEIGPEEEEELEDALSPAYDQLFLMPAWWLLEILPVRNGDRASGRPGRRYRFVVLRIVFYNY